MQFINGIAMALLIIWGCQMVYSVYLIYKDMKGDRND